MTFDSIPSAWRGHEQFAEWLVRTMRPEVIDSRAGALTRYPRGLDRPSRG
jgi:hypothetical protein